MRLEERRGVTYWLRGEHIGEKPTGAEIGIGDVKPIAEYGERRRSLKHTNHKERFILNIERN